MRKDIGSPELFEEIDENGDSLFDRLVRDVKGLVEQVSQREDIEPATVRQIMEDIV